LITWTIHDEQYRSWSSIGNDTKMSFNEIGWVGVDWTEKTSGALLWTR
jgi:hypothetical protein